MLVKLRGMNSWQLPEQEAALKNCAVMCRAEQCTHADLDVMLVCWHAGCCCCWVVARIPSATRWATQAVPPRLASP